MYLLHHSKAAGTFPQCSGERLLAEAEKLAEQGVKELILVAQETTVYRWICTERRGCRSF